MCDAWLDPLQSPLGCLLRRVLTLRLSGHCNQRNPGRLLAVKIVCIFPTFYDTHASRHAMRPDTRPGCRTWHAGSCSGRLLAILDAATARCF